MASGAGVGHTRQPHKANQPFMAYFSTTRNPVSHEHEPQTKPTRALIHTRCRLARACHHSSPPLGAPDIHKQSRSATHQEPHRIQAKRTLWRCRWPEQSCSAPRAHPSADCATGGLRRAAPRRDQTHLAPDICHSEGRLRLLGWRQLSALLEEPLHAARSQTLQTSR